MKRKLCLSILTLCLGLPAQTEITAVFYNLHNYPTTPPLNREQISGNIFEELQPDIFMVCELKSNAGNVEIQNNPLVDVFVSHLKAGSTDTDQAIRLSMIEDFATYLEDQDLNQNSNVIFTSNLNLRSSTEQSNQFLLFNTNIQFKGSIDSPGNWHNNSIFASLHTQSTRISNDPFDNFAAAGRVDDRFDFIHLSENMLNEDNQVSYIPKSYVAVGNNGNCFNDRIEDSDCSGVFSTFSREQVFLMSDHLPVLTRLAINDEVLSVENQQANATLARFVSSNIVGEDEGQEIAFAKTNELPKSVSIYDQINRRVGIATVQTTNLQIPIQQLARGVYYITLYGQSAEIIKFIKTR